ncbi:MAG: type II secretion system protein [Nitrospiraceae bacterium]
MDETPTQMPQLIKPTGRLRGSRLPNQRGFTLIEIVLTLGLLALVIGIAVPRFGWFENAATASRKLIGVIHTLRTVAPLTQQTWRLYLDLDQGQYWAMVMTPEGEQVPKDVRFQDPEIETLPRRMLLPAGVRFERTTTATQGLRQSGQVFLQVPPTGLPEPALLVLSDTDRTLLALHVSPLTGLVRVSDQELEPIPMPPLPEQIRPLLFPDTYGGSISL